MYHQGQGHGQGHWGQEYQHWPQQTPVPASAPPAIDPFATQHGLSTIYNDQRYEAPSQYEALSNIYADQTYVASTTRPAAPATPAVDGMERFQVTLLPSDTSEPESVFLQVGLDGVQVLHEHTRRILRVYALDAISRWAMPDASVLTFWYKPTGEHDEQAVRVMATERINRCLLDTLTCSCLQLCEMRGIPFSSADDSSDDKDVEFWTAPEREGWLMKQGEHIKTWRRRWFVLKQGRIFWFKEHRLTPQSNPRGIVRLSAVQEVRSTDDPKYQKHTFELIMKSGPPQYFTADTEAEKQAWIDELHRKRLALRTDTQEAAGQLTDLLATHLRGYA